MSPRISLCVITGNEAATIERFLASFSGAFDELCIVRATGNVPHDKTLSLAKSWCSANGKAFVCAEYFNGHGPSRPPADKATGIDEMDPATWPHVDDFAAARNVAWSLATSPWQFWADIDDTLSPGGAELIRLCAAAGTHDQFFFTYDLRSQRESNVRERMFRTGISRWVQPVHEQCRLIKDAPEGKPWRGLIEKRVIFSHEPTAEKVRDPARNRRIMAYQVRYIHAYAFELHREWFYQWQVSRSAPDAENATKWAEIAHQTDCLPEQRFDMLLHQAQIAAEKDIEHAIDLCWSAIRIDPKNRSGWGDLAEYELKKGRGGRAVVATAFMQSIPKPPPNGYPLSERYYGWEGAHLRVHSLRAIGKEEVARKVEDSLFAQNGKRISLLHATRGRPQQALECRNMWFASAFVPLGVEHIFAIDADDKASLDALKNYRHVIINPPGGCVKAWNAAAAVSTGNVLVQLSDDWVPCHDWDELIWEALQGEVFNRNPGASKAALEVTPAQIGETSLVLAVHDGHRNDALLCMAILTRARYLQQRDRDAAGQGAGEPYLFHPDYFGVYSDNEFTMRAYDDGVVLTAKHIVFDHRHPIFEGKPVDQWDETHRRQNAPERYRAGLEIFNRRNPKFAIK